MSRTKEIRDLLSRLRKQGFLVARVQNGHWSVINPDTGQSCQIPHSPRQSRGVLNATTRLKRIGFDPHR
jgi:hypothetical protein